MPQAPKADAEARRLRSDADRLLVRIAGHGGWWLALLGGASLAGAVAQVLLPAAIGRVLDAILAPAGPGTGTRWLAWCIVLVAVIVTTAVMIQLATGMASATATAWLRRMLAVHVLGCGPRLTEHLSSGDTVSRVVGGTADAGAAPASAVLAVTAVIPPAGSVLALGLIDPWLMVAFAAGFPVLALVLRRLVRDSSEVSAGYQQAQGTIAARLLDALAGAATIAAAGTRDEEQRRILAPLASLRGQGYASWRIQARAAAQGAVVVPLLQVIVLAVAGIELARHRITPGDLVAASQYAVLAVGIGASIGQLNRLGRARGGARRAAGLLARPRPRYGTQGLGPGTGQLRFRDVTVRRDGAVLLSSLDLTVPGGAAVAIVGRSGAGKSTLASLAGRLIDPDQGEVELDDHVLRWLTRRALREAVVYAFERPALFGATPFEAISFGVSPPSREDVLAAATDSRAAGFLARLPRDIDTPLDDVPMSGGEVQRLGLARAFAHARGARLLILDDATSSLDTATEMLISQVLTDRLSDRTRLIVAHRAATAARADLVAWLDNGRLRALSSHRELWAHPDYRAIFAASAWTADPAC
jgi:ATP-binding cassette, subfamily B, bacterial RamA/AmfB